MAIKASFVLKDNAISILSKSSEFTLKEKKETIINLNNSSYVVDLTNIDNVCLLVFEGSGEFTVTFVQDANTVTHTVTDFFVLTLTPASASSFTSITIAETNEEDVSIHAFVYGKVTTA